MKLDLKKIFFQPYLASVLRYKTLCLVLVIFPLILVLLQIFDIKIWVCFFHQVTGLKCPGCGLTRGLACLFRGKVYESFLWHPSAFFFMLGWLLLFLSLIIPVKKREQIINLLDKLEKKTGLIMIFLLFFLMFGVARLIYEIYFDKI